MPFGEIKDKNGLFNPFFSGLLKRKGENSEGLVSSGGFQHDLFSLARDVSFP